MATRPFRKGRGRSEILGRLQAEGVCRNLIEYGSVNGRSAMKTVFALLIALGASLAGAVTVHRSFRNGYPAGAQGVTVRQQPNAAVLTAPKMAQAKTKVVTNRVVITKEQAEKLMKDKKRFKEVKKPNEKAAKQ